MGAASRAIADDAQIACVLISLKKAMPRAMIHVRHAMANKGVK